MLCFPVPECLPLCPSPCRVISACTPHVPCYLTVMCFCGLQGEDPGTDFRGAGLFGLDNLVYLGTHHPTLFQQLLHKTQGKRSDWEYPFASAGLNLTFMLSEVLGIAGSSPGQLPTTAAGESSSRQCHSTFVVCSAVL